MKTRVEIPGKLSRIYNSFVIIYYCRFQNTLKMNCHFPNSDERLQSYSLQKNYISSRYFSKIAAIAKCSRWHFSGVLFKEIYDILTHENWWLTFYSLQMNGTFKIISPHVLNSINYSKFDILQNTFETYTINSACI